MFVVAATVAPRVAKSVSGRFTLYGAMALTAVLIVLTTAFIIYLFATVAAPGLGAYGWGFFLGLIFFVVLMNLVNLRSPGR